MSNATIDANKALVLAHYDAVTRLSSNLMGFR
ncbi:hypothetical protein AB7M47_008635 [Bradyrhizobium elkanii]|jgi:hypothetical protein